MCAIVNRLSYIDNKITKEDFFDRIYRKSKSENTRHAAETALGNFDLFCKHAYQKETDQVIDDLTSVNNPRKTFVFFQKFIGFLQEDHPETLLRKMPKGCHSRPKYQVPSKYMSANQENIPRCEVFL